MVSFTTKLEHIIATNGSRLAIYLSPDIALIPQYILRYDEPFLPFGKEVINATSKNGCCYIFDLAAYMALGAVGMIALERTIDYVGSEHITVLDGAFSDSDYVIVMDENSFGVDAITVSATFDVNAQIRYDRGVFLISDTLPNNIPKEQNLGFKVNDELHVNSISMKILDRNFVYQDRRDSFTETLRHQIEHYPQ